MRQWLISLCLTGWCTLAVADAVQSCDWQGQWPTGAPSLDIDEIAQRALDEQWSSEPDFACSAVLVTIGCGTGCATGGIYDHATQTWQGLGFAIHRGLRQTRPLLAYSADSNVLTASGYLNEEFEGVFRYQWDGHQLNRKEY